MNIAWIGTGVMGSSMASHLLADGHQLTVFTRTRAKAEPLLQASAEWAESPAAAARNAEVVCTMLGYPDDVRGVVLSDDGVLAAMKPDSLFIDFTTSSPALAADIFHAAQDRQIDALDAPVSGGDIGARNATLSIMVGGEKQAFDRARPIFELLGKTIVHQGPAGCGQHTKMVNQTLIAAGMIAVCEGLLYARAVGLDPQTVLQSVGGGAAASWSLDNYYPRMLKDDFAPGFYVEHFIKDMGIALDEARRCNLQLPGLELAEKMYRRLAAMGHQRAGTQALIKVLEEMNREAKK